MTAKAAPERSGEAVPQEAIDNTIHEFGDARAAIACLLAEIDRLEHELAMTRPVVSRGFSRGWHHDRWAHDGQA
ncbi:hypothetical protein [Mesorhizobium sp. CN2-181]|uniref:hypothetical protein n=1 Tax=Mesorhizobium yinganensis TaxID=3157707 RepID=UPI0032B8066D